MCSSGATHAISHTSAAAGHAATPHARLDILQLEDAISIYLAGAFAPATMRVYGSRQRRYLAFCSRTIATGGTHTVHVWVIFGEGRALSPDNKVLSVCTTISSQVKATLSLLQYVLRGVKRSPAHSPRAPRMTITPVILRILKDQWAAAALRDKDFVMLWATCCMGFFGFMRAGEFSVTQVSESDPATSLCLENIAVDNPSVVQVQLNQSKTDRGDSIYFGRTPSVGA